MNKIYFYFLVVILSLYPRHHAFAQAGAVYTAAGGGSSVAEGVPATTAALSNTTGIGVDAAGNLYVAERGHYVIRKIDGGSGLINTIAGTGTAGYTGDGGPATAALLSNNMRGIHVTPAGDVYISDNTVVRKVNGATGVITRVAGGGSSMADGVPATTASLSLNHVFADTAGNIYIGSGNKIRKVDASSGIITTIAGGGMSTAEGIPATAALISGSAKSICTDNAGNLYIIGGSMSEKIRKIDAATGLITTVAGGGSATTEGIPATNMALNDVHTCRVDGAGNIFIADWNRGLIRRVDAATGIVNTIAGAPSGGSAAEGTPALSADVNPYMIWIDPPSGNIYYSDFSTRVKRLSYSPMVPFTGSGGSGGGGGGGGTGPVGYFSDSFYVAIHKQCNGPQLTLRTHSYHSV